MSPSAFLPLAELLPHRGPALLLERVVDWSADEATCEGTLTADFPYARNGQVETVCGLELLAQTAAVYLALSRRAAKPTGPTPHDDVHISSGYLVGVPLAEFHGAWLPLHVPLTAQVKSLWQMGGAARFRGELRAGAQTLLSAELQVFQPNSGQAPAHGPPTESS